MSEAQSLIEAYLKDPLVRMKKLPTEHLLDSRIHDSEYQWEKTARGYRLPNGFAELILQNRMWYLLVRELGITSELGRRPSFDKANRELDRIVASKPKQVGSPGPSKLKRRFR